MQVAKWGNSLAVRLPRGSFVRGNLTLKEGDQIDLVKDDGQVKVRRLARADEVLNGLRRFRGKLPAAERLSRDAAHEPLSSPTQMSFLRSYLLDDGPKADRAEVILGQGPRISVQVLNESLVNCRRKAGLQFGGNQRPFSKACAPCVPSRISPCRPMRRRPRLWRNATASRSTTR